MAEDRRILSIQSHVTHGFVGNKAATFPLQCLGWDVDVLNTVNFSNHTGYGKVEGSVMTPEELQQIYSQINALKLTNHYNCLLTGYVPNKDLLTEICNVGKSLKESSNKEILWLLDPVMGDEGVLYVDSSVVKIYQDVIKSGYVDIITPNQFEIELILGFPVNNQQSINKALGILHQDYGIKYVIITSLYLNDDKTKLYLVSSSQKDHKPNVQEIKPVVEGYFTGVGDLFSALILDKIYRRQLEEKNINYQQMLDRSVDETMATMRLVLQQTKAAAAAAAEASSSQSGSSDGTASSSGAKINSKAMGSYELRLVDCMRFFT